MWRSCGISYLSTAAAAAFFVWDSSEGDGFGVGELEGDADAACAEGTGAVVHAERDGEELAGVEFAGSGFEVDRETAFDDEEGLVGVGVVVPVVGLGHGGDADDVIVDGGDGVVVVAAAGWGFCFQGDDVGELGVHSRPHPDFSVGVSWSLGGVDVWCDEWRVSV